MRPSDLCDLARMDQWRRWAHRDRQFVSIKPHTADRGSEPTWTIHGNSEMIDLNQFSKLVKEGVLQQLAAFEFFSMKSLGIWYCDGPKTFYPTVDQCEALDNVAVNLSLQDYQQPYPAIAIALPAGRYPPHRWAVIYYEGKELVLTMSDVGAKGFLTAMIPPETPLETLEDYLTYNSRSIPIPDRMKRALRLALNSCLALTNFGCQLKACYPHDEERDRRLAQEDSERGKRARDRLHPSKLPTKISFSQHVVLHETEDRSSKNGETSDAEKTCHWRRGHWAMQAYGPHHSLRKRIFRKPVLVRADLFVGESSDTDVRYKIREQTP